jgi:hypothetical protein
MKCPNCGSRNVRANRWNTGAVPGFTCTCVKCHGTSGRMYACGGCSQYVCRTCMMKRPVIVLVVCALAAIMVWHFFF